MIARIFKIYLLYCELRYMINFVIYIFVQLHLTYQMIHVTTNERVEHPENIF